MTGATANDTTDQELTSKLQPSSSNSTCMRKLVKRQVIEYQVFARDSRAVMICYLIEPYLVVPHKKEAARKTSKPTQKLQESLSKTLINARAHQLLIAKGGKQPSEKEFVFRGVVGAPPPFGRSPTRGWLRFSTPPCLGRSEKERFKVRWWSFFTSLVGAHP